MRRYNENVMKRRGGNCMRQYRIQKTQEVAKIICNKCGKEIEVTNGVMEQEMCSVEKRWGYFSQKDNEVHRFDLCEACYDEFVSTFSVPVEIE